MGYWAKDGAYIHEDDELYTIEAYEKAKREAQFKAFDSLTDEEKERIGKEMRSSDRSELLEEKNRLQSIYDDKKKLDIPAESILRQYFETGQKPSSEKFELALNRAMLSPDILKELFSNTLEKINNAISTLEKSKLPEDLVAPTTLYITTKLDTITDILYSLRNREYSFNDISIGEIKEDFKNLDIAERLWQLHKKYNMPVTMALPCDFVDNENNSIYDARRGNASSVINFMFDDLSGKNSFQSWDDLEYGKHYKPDAPNWNRILGGVLPTGEVIEPSKYTVELSKLMKDAGYTLPVIKEGKMVYESKDNTEIRYKR